MHDEEGCPLFRLATTSHDSLAAWLMLVVEFVDLSLGEEVTPVLVFDRGGAFPGTMAELREAGAEFVTYERKPYQQIPVTEFTESLIITLPSAPRRPIRILYVEAPQKNLRGGRGLVRRIAMLTEEGEQVNLLAVSELPAETLIRGHLARWGRQENQLKYESSAGESTTSMAAEWRSIRRTRSSPTLRGAGSIGRFISHTPRRGRRGGRGAGRRTDRSATRPSSTSIGRWSGSATSWPNAPRYPRWRR